MKRQKKTVEKRTYAMKGAIPRFVSLVSRGANFTPLAQLRYDETDKFGQDVEIHRIEFSKTSFATQAQVESYLQENAYEDFSIEEGKATWVVLGQDAEKFEDVQPIEYEDGVLYFVGKLKEEVANEESVDAPAAEVISSEEFSEDKPEEVTTEEVVQESDEEVVESSEETDTEVEEVSSEEGEEGFTAEEVTTEEATQEEVTEEVKTFSAEEVMSRIDAIEAKFAEEKAALEAEITELKEKLEKFEEKTEETIDENEIVIQNSQAVISDEIIKEEIKEKDEKAEKFSQNRKNDLFGLRG